jgi:hypothetical protein
VQLPQGLHKTEIDSTDFNGFINFSKNHESYVAFLFNIINIKLSKPKFVASERSLHILITLQLSQL